MGGLLLVALDSVLKAFWWLRSQWEVSSATKHSYPCRALSLVLTHCLTMASDSLPFYRYGVPDISLCSMRALLRHFQDYSGTPKPCETATLIVPLEHVSWKTHCHHTTYGGIPDRAPMIPSSRGLGWSTDSTQTPSIRQTSLTMDRFLDSRCFILVQPLPFDHEFRSTQTTFSFAQAIFSLSSPLNYTLPLSCELITFIRGSRWPCLHSFLRSSRAWSVHRSRRPL